VGFSTQKLHIFRVDFPTVPVGAVVAARKNGNAVFLNISAPARNIMAATPRANG